MRCFFGECLYLLLVGDYLAFWEGCLILSELGRERTTHMDYCCFTSVSDLGCSTVFAGVACSWLMNGPSPVAAGWLCW